MLYVMLCYVMLLYDMANANLWDWMLWLEIPMPCYLIQILWFEIAILSYAMVYVVENMLELTVIVKSFLLSLSYSPLNNFKWIEDRYVVRAYKLQIYTYNILLNFVLPVLFVWFD